MNCCVAPSGVETTGGLIAIETNAAAVTVKPVEPVTVPEAAVTLAVPVPMLVARPVLFTVTVASVSDAQVAVALRSCVLPSLKVPVATNCCVVPKAIEGFAGLTAIDSRTAAVTLMVVLPLTDPELAVICADPVPNVEASPLVFVVLLIVAMAGALELHCTVLVKSCVLPSVKVPVALNCCVMPKATPGIAGVIAKETKAGGVTFRVVEPLTFPVVAMTLALPTDTLVASPWLFTVNTAGFRPLQLTLLVRSSVLPSV